MTLRISASNIRLFSHCQTLWGDRYIHGNRSSESSDDLEFGSAWHSALEHGKEKLDPDCSLGVRTREAGNILLSAYHDWYRDNPLVVTEREVEFSYDGTDIPIAGVFDGIGTFDGQRVIVEHKTTKSLIEGPDQPYWLRLVFDHQVNMYLLAGRNLGIRHMLYDVVRKPQLRPRKGEKIEWYLDRVADDIYNSPASYFQRRVFTRSDAYLDRYAKQLRVIVRQQEIARLHPGSLPKNPQSCYSFGRYCPRYDLCQEEMDNE